MTTAGAIVLAAWGGGGLLLGLTVGVLVKRYDERTQPAGPSDAPPGLIAMFAWALAPLVAFGALAFAAYWLMERAINGADCAVPSRERNLAAREARIARLEREVGLGD